MRRRNFLVGIGAAAISVSPARAQCLRRIRPGTGLHIVAHRGRMTPNGIENSLPDILETWSKDCLVEVDIAATRDGALALLHDLTLERETTATGPVAALLSAELGPIRRRNSSGAPTQRPISMLSELLAAAAGNDTPAIMLDIKSSPPVDVIAAVRAAGLVERAVVLTFSLATAEVALAAAPDGWISQFASDPTEVTAAANRVKGGRLAVYVPQHGALETFAAARAAGALIITDTQFPAPDGSLEERADLQGPQVYRDFLAKRSVDLLVTNRPLDLRQALACAS